MIHSSAVLGLFLMFLDDSERSVSLLFKTSRNIKIGSGMAELGRQTCSTFLKISNNKEIILIYHLILLLTSCLGYYKGPTPLKGKAPASYIKEGVLRGFKREFRSSVALWHLIRDLFSLKHPLISPEMNVSR